MHHEVTNFTQLQDSNRFCKSVMIFTFMCMVRISYSELTMNLIIDSSIFIDIYSIILEIGNMQESSTNITHDLELFKQRRNIQV